MIYIERTITINKNEATIEEPIVLYRGDKNIEIQFTINNNPFKYKVGTAITYGQLVIIRPNATAIIPEPAKLSNGRVLFTIADGMIDENIELGSYDFQIRMINADQTSRGTLPPVTGGIVIKEPICEEAAVNVAYVNSRSTIVMPDNNIMTLAIDDNGAIFDNNNDYIRTNWNSGDIITDTKLNKIEEALYQINDNASNDYATEEYVDDAVRSTMDYVIDNFATTSYVDNELYRAEIRAGRYTDDAIGSLNLDNYATVSYVDDQRRATEAASEAYIDNAIGRLDLSNYAKESFVTDSINSNNNYIETVILRDYVTDQELEDAINGIEGGGNVDLTGYATEAYVDQALTNYPTHSEMKSTVKDVMPDIIEINHSVFTGDEFAIDDYNNYVAKSVLLYNTTIGFDSYKHELVHMQLGMDYESSNRTIVVYSPRGSIFSYSITKDGTITRTGIKSFATQDTINSTLSKRNYATQDYVNEQIGDINAILDAINGEEV